MHTTEVERGSKKGSATTVAFSRELRYTVVEFYGGGATRWQSFTGAKQQGGIASQGLSNTVAKLYGGGVLWGLSFMGAEQHGDRVDF